ncbi:MAG: hypothetical protein LDL41_07610 [Coleofasciculus sp. S288]|nr:hypothetical protein [Coleofasciculus sp. S288]
MNILLFSSPIPIHPLVYLVLDALLILPSRQKNTHSWIGSKAIALSNYSRHFFCFATAKMSGVRKQPAFYAIAISGYRPLP